MRGAYSVNAVAQWVCQLDSVCGLCRCIGSGVGWCPLRRTLMNWTLMKDGLGQSIWKNHVFINKRLHFMKTSNRIFSGAPFSQEWGHPMVFYTKRIISNAYLAMILIICSKGPMDGPVCKSCGCVSLMCISGTSECILHQHLKMCFILLKGEHADSHQGKNTR